MINEKRALCKCSIFVQTGGCPNKFAMFYGENWCLKRWDGMRYLFFELFHQFPMCPILLVRRKWKNAWFAQLETSIYGECPIAMFDYRRVPNKQISTWWTSIVFLASLKRFNIDLINNDAHFIGLDQQRGLNSICPTNVCCLFDFNSKNQDLCVQSHQWAWESQITTTDLMIK